MAIDLALNRSLTKAFIDYLPVTVTLIPHRRVDTPSGGFTYEALAPRAPQVMTLIEQSGGTTTGVPLPVPAQDGDDRRVMFELLGEWNAIIEVDDTFSHQGKEWTVVAKFYANGYEVRALVNCHG